MRAVQTIPAFLLNARMIKKSAWRMYSFISLRIVLENAKGKPAVQEAGDWNPRGERAQLRINQLHNRDQKSEMFPEM